MDPIPFRLELPSLLNHHDEGAIAASAEIVLERNPNLSGNLRLARNETLPGANDLVVPGELYLRIRKPAAIDGRRSDVPDNPFAARALRPVPAREFKPRSRSVFLAPGE